MSSATNTDRRPQTIAIDPDSVRVGKDVIEILTTGMYIAPITIYREYVQNAADSIDVARLQGLLPPTDLGQVKITIDHGNRSVLIRDNGAGLAVSEAVQVLLSIGASKKRGMTARGFRGVGRLSGLAYCRELVFRTKASGDDQVAIMSWDCRRLRERLADDTLKDDLQQIITNSVSVTYERADAKNAHFFEVQLNEVVRLRNDILLNEKMIADYLAQVAPVPFSEEFLYASEIRNRLADHKGTLPVELTVADLTVTRPYADKMIFPGSLNELNLKDIEFFELADVDGNIGALGWIAHHEYVRSLPTSLGVRGLRARVGDLQVGDDNLFDHLYKESRFNGWVIGELHILDDRIRPNARRDEFELNHHYYNLLVQLGPIAIKLSQHCRTASVSRNAVQIILNLLSEADDRFKEERKFDPLELSRLKAAVERARSKTKRIADTDLKAALEDKLDALAARLDKVRPTKGASVVAVDEATALVSRHVTNREQARKLIEELRRLCS